jgi:phosphohistidine phosphatase SixA
MPKIFMLRHAIAEQQATLEDDSKFRRTLRTEEVSYI